MLASRWGDRITYVADDAKDRLGLSAALVRPDGFVAWACDGTPDDEEVAQAASRWFGQSMEAQAFP
ncbi:bsl7397 [Bradyrhizobium diazoefficiens USDA 110]|uniref:Bsl7397 protein n=2 Tax=Bradyrhizobium diazoefficiens TaxID=1355477 RepID=Q89DP2_BRADU|nr:bsl7397 [Bradyrhizobium diazoefficiens USDA 110]